MVIILHVEIADLLGANPVRIGSTFDCQPQSAGSVVVADNAAESLVQSSYACCFSSGVGCSVANRGRLARMTCAEKSSADDSTRSPVGDAPHGILTLPSAAVNVASTRSHQPARRLTCWIMVYARRRDRRLHNARGEQPAVCSTALVGWRSHTQDASRRPRFASPHVLGVPVNRAT